MSHEREQKLVDVCFALVLTATSEQHSEHFRRMSDHDKAAWVADQLRQCGFDSTPVGASWGVLLELLKRCAQCGKPYDRPARHNLCSMDCVVAFETGVPK